MNPKDKYNAIIETIEKEVKTALSNAKICEDAFRAGYADFISVRGRNAIFVFMINQSVNDYITERRMMNVYNYLITTPKYDLNKAYDMANIQSQKAFIAKFKKVFNNLTPDKAAKAKDESLIRPAKTWELVTTEAKEAFSQFTEEKNMTETKFGVPVIQAINIHAAQTLQDFFGLNDKEADFAFHLAEDHSLTYDETFEYVYNYVWKYIEKADTDQALRDHRLDEDLKNNDVLFLYFKKRRTFSDIYDLLESKNALGYKEDISTLSENRSQNLYEHFRSKKEDKHIDQVYITDMVEEVDVDAVNEAAYGGIDEYMETYSDDGYDIDADDYEAQQDSYDLYDVEDRMWEIYEDWSSIREEINLNNPEQYKKLCENVEKEIALYKGSPRRRLPENLDDLDVVSRKKDDKRNRIEAIFMSENRALEFGSDPLYFSSYGPIPETIFSVINKYIEDYPEDYDSDWIKDMINKTEHYYDQVEIRQYKHTENGVQYITYSSISEIPEKIKENIILTWEDFQKEKQRWDEEDRKTEEEEKKCEEEKKMLEKENKLLEEEIWRKVFKCEEGDRLFYKGKDAQYTEYTIIDIIDRGIARIRNDKGNDITINLFYCIKKGLAKRI